MDKVFIIEKVREILLSGFNSNGINGLNSSYTYVINSALNDFRCSIYELKSIKSIYDEIHSDWEKSLNLESNSEIDSENNYFCQDDDSLVCGKKTCVGCEFAEPAESIELDSNKINYYCHAPERDHS